MRSYHSARHWRGGGTGNQSSTAAPSDVRWRQPAADLDPAAGLDVQAAA